ncbi:MAG: prephenate dehydrogenase/arogenate dehydrogenase family protein [Chloroflexota bacterium]|nr:prephenate dehydrogenase/arogenate dehydrogenase family protein [Chloroflexia bacterium]MDQ3168444.1 prephenate dehydrogenase/arogenate dehydrogenase family protein [Chloroflexota bacterium]MDQ3513832.1 prephenate dehydrogenase/arogenate dehydrogenase family protein [Chloroflexota bacterium]
MQRVTIIGLGLVGGSIGLGLRRWSADQGGSGPALRITGFDTDLDHQQHAKKIGAVDHAEWKLTNAIGDADLVVLATPVAAMRESMGDIASFLKPGAVVTDTGSTKADVLTWANASIPAGVSFVGGHPMAGKAQSIEAADADLFKGATWCVCPSVTASEDANKVVLGMIAALGAEPYFIDPHEHDAYVAGVSHLPFVVSTALMRAVSNDPSWRDMRALTATGFRDLTRLAAGGPEMHRDIVLTNTEAVERWVDAMVQELQGFKAMLRAEDRPDQLQAFFAGARDARADWSTQTTREGELLQETRDELSAVNMSGQMTRMLFGSFAGRRRSPSARRPAKPGRDGAGDS